MNIQIVLSLFLLAATSQINASGYETHTTTTRDVTTQHVIHHHANNNGSNQPRWAEFMKFVGSKYGLSLTAGAATGMLCGAGCRLTNNYMPWFVSWIIWVAIRSKSVEAIQKDLKQFNIPHSDALISNGAWVADWLTYIAFAPEPSKTMKMIMLCIQ